MTLGETYYKWQKAEDRVNKLQEENEDLKRLWTESMSREYKLMKFITEKWGVFHR